MPIIQGRVDRSLSLPPPPPVLLALLLYYLVCVLLMHMPMLTIPNAPLLMRRGCYSFSTLSQPQHCLSISYSDLFGVLRLQQSKDGTKHYRVAK